MLHTGTLSWWLMMVIDCQWSIGGQQPQTQLGDASWMAVPRFPGFPLELCVAGVYHQSSEPADRVISNGANDSHP